MVFSNDLHCVLRKNWQDKDIRRAIFTTKLKKPPKAWILSSHLAFHNMCNAGVLTKNTGMSKQYPYTYYPCLSYHFLAALLVKNRYKFCEVIFTHALESWNELEIFHSGGTCERKYLQHWRRTTRAAFPECSLRKINESCRNVAANFTEHLLPVCVWVCVLLGTAA